MIITYNSSPYPDLLHQAHLAAGQVLQWEATQIHVIQFKPSVSNILRAYTVFHLMRFASFCLHLSRKRIDLRWRHKISNLYLVVANIIANHWWNFFCQNPDENVSDTIGSPSATEDNKVWIGRLEKVVIVMMPFSTAPARDTVAVFIYNGIVKFILYWWFHALSVYIAILKLDIQSNHDRS